MTDVLTQILADKHREVEAAAAARPVTDLRSAPGYHEPRRNFFGAVAAPRRDRANLIAEVKQRSPSAGLIRPDFDVALLASAYERGGASALSVLTDAKWFGGDGSHIAIAKHACGLPVLRKDFVIDEYQLHEARMLGADAVLLIAEALEPRHLAGLCESAVALGLCVLVEVHSREALHGVLGAISLEKCRGSLLLGVNNRDLRRQVTDIGITERLAPEVPPTAPLVAESGIRSHSDAQRMFLAGARALLVGEALLKEPDVTAAARRMMEGGS
ncbi:MAG: indole-3-glycerol-phosphate synthase [Planctomycetia bacterium]|nr:MAG: indole-3-glycerol-phosphate synthase [Planctomycetia bacterium]